MKKLLLAIIVAISLTSCTKELSRESIVVKKCGTVIYSRPVLKTITVLYISDSAMVSYTIDDSPSFPKLGDQYCK